jgi:hypothetical protein
MHIRLKVKLLPKLLTAPEGTPIRIAKPGDVIDLPDAEAERMIFLGHAVPASVEQLRSSGA